MATTATIPTTTQGLPPPAADTPPYPPPAAQPTQHGPEGIRFDFNEGARILLPERASGTWRVRLSDLDTGNTLFESENTGAVVLSSKRFYVRFHIEVEQLGADGTATPVFAHTLDLHRRPVLVHFPIGTLGDILAWFPYAARFAERHGCDLTCTMAADLAAILRDAYPTIRFATPEQAAEQGLAERAYATYCLGLFFDDADCVHQPSDFRLVGLHRTAGYILGVDPSETAPRLGLPSEALPDEGPPIPEPYVCIAVQASTYCKTWSNPFGWRETIAFLRAQGYRVICIDREPVHGTGLAWTHIPHGAEDETGPRPLAERARWLRHARAFIGTSSGLSWLAWAAGTPVVLISGFTHPTNEFATPYRVINWHACNSCWNDVRHRFDHKDFLWCPRHAGTERQFECARLITAAQVIATLSRIPGLVRDASDPPAPSPRGTPSAPPPAPAAGTAG